MQGDLGCFGSEGRKSELRQPLFKWKPCWVSGFWLGPELATRGRPLGIRSCFLVPINKVRRMSLTCSSPPAHTPPHLISVFTPGGEDADPHQSVLIEGRDAGASEPSSQAPGAWTEEELQKLDRESDSTVLWPQLRTVPGGRLRPRLLSGVH